MAAPPPSRPGPKKKDTVTAKDVALAVTVFGGIFLLVGYKLKSCGEGGAAPAVTAPAPKQPPVRAAVDGPESVVRGLSDGIRRRGYTTMFPDKTGEEVEEGVSRILIDNLGTWPMKFILDGEEIFEVKVPFQQSAEIELRSGEYDLFIASDRSDVPSAGGRLTIAGVYHLALQVQGDERFESAVHTCTGEHRRIRSLPR